MDDFLKGYGKIPTNVILKRHKNTNDVSIIESILPAHFPHAQYKNEYHDDKLFELFESLFFNNFNSVILDSMLVWIKKAMEEESYGSYKTIAKKNYKFNFYNIEQSFSIKMGNVYQKSINDFLNAIGAEFKINSEERFELKKSIEVEHKQLDSLCFFKRSLLAGEFKFNLHLDTEKGPATRDRVLFIDKITENFCANRFIFLVSLSCPTRYDIKNIAVSLKQINDFIYGWREFFAVLNIWFSDDKWAALAQKTYALGLAECNKILKDI